MARIVLDSCVALSAMKPSESTHAVCSAVINTARHRGDEVCIAITTMFDFAAALNHPEKIARPFLAEKFHVQVTFISVDEKLFQEFWSMPVRLAMTGPDLIILACGRRLGAPIITTDPAMLKHGAAYGVRVLSPEEYLRP